MEKDKSRTIHTKPDPNLLKEIFNGVHNITRRVSGLSTPGTEIIDDRGILDGSDLKVKDDQYSERERANVNPGTHLPEEDILLEEKYSTSK